MVCSLSQMLAIASSLMLAATRRYLRTHLLLPVLPERCRKDSLPIPQTPPRDSPLDGAMNEECGTWKKKKKKDFFFRCDETCSYEWRGMFSFFYLLLLPSLRSFTAVSKAFLLVEPSGIVAGTTVAGCFVLIPIAADALTVYPHLTFAHRIHI